MRLVVGEQLMESPVFEKGYPCYDAVNRKDPTVNELRKILSSHGLEFHVKKVKNGNIAKVNVLVREDE